MNPISIFPLLCFFLVIVLGFHGYYLDSRSKLNRIYLVLFLLISMELFIIFGYLQSETVSQARFWWRADIIWPFIVPSLFLFILAYTGKKNRSLEIFSAILMGAISISFFVIDLCTDRITGPPKEYLGGYYFTMGNGDTAILLNSIVVTSLVIIASSMMIRSFLRSPDGKERTASFMILLGIFIPSTIGLIFDNTTPFFNVQVPLAFPISLVLGCIFIWNGLRIQSHYRINKNKAAPSIIDSIPDGIIITDRIGGLVSQNRGSRELLGFSDQDLEKMHARDIFPSGSSVFSSIGPVSSNSMFTRWSPENLEINVLTKHAHEIPVSLTKVSIQDRKERDQGYAIIMRDQTFKKIFEKEVDRRRSTLEGAVLKRAKELEDSNVKLNRAVRELRATRSRSENEKRKAELYLDIMTHDISNLHQGVQAWLSMAGLNIEDPDRVSDFIKKARESVDRSIWLVKNIILISDLRKTKPDLGPVEVITALKRSIDKARSQFNARDVTINVHNPYSRLMIEADDQIEEVFFHVLHNGLKFSKNGSPKVDVTLNVENGGHDLTISFIDQGRGIPECKKEDVFNRLESKEKYSHTGLGLALVKTLMARYKGTVWITDRVHGDNSKGAVFHLRFMLLEYG